MNIARLAVLFIALLAAISCGSRGEEGAADAVDFSALQRRTHLAFRAHGSSFVSAHGTMGARVDPSGTVRFATRRDRSTAAALTFATKSIARSGVSPAEHAARAVLAEGAVEIDRTVATERLELTERGLEQSWRFTRAPSGAGDLVVRVHAESATAPRAVDDGVAFGEIAYRAARWIDARGAISDLALHIENGDVVVVVPSAVVDATAFPAVLDPTIGPELALTDAIMANAGFDWSDPYVAAGASGTFLVSWIDTRFEPEDDYNWLASEQVLGARVAANGAVLDPTGIFIAPPSDFYGDKVRAAFDGTNWLVAWSETPSVGPCRRIVASRVSAAGVVLDPAGIHVTCSNIDFDVAFDGGAFLVVFASQSLTAPSGFAMLGRRITTAGALSGTLPFTVYETGTSGRVACDGATTCLYVGASTSGLAGVLLAKGGGPTGGTIAITATSTDTDPAVAWNGTDFVVGWRNGAGGTSAKRVATSGTIVDGAPIAIASAAYEGMAVANGQTLFAWADGTSKQLRAVRLTSGGSVLDATPLTMTTSAAACPSNSRRTAIAASTTDYLVAWCDTSGALDGNTLYAGRFDLTGSSLDGDGNVVRKAANGEWLTAAAGDATTGWLVVWNDLRAGNLTGAVRGSRLDASGTSLDKGGILVSAVGATPQVARGANEWLVAWDSGPNVTGFGPSIKAALVDAAGTVGAPITIDASGAEHHDPTVVFDGTNYAVAWATWGGSAQVYYVRVTPSGTVLDTPPILIGTGADGLGFRMRAVSDGQDVLVVYAGIDASSSTSGYEIAGVRVSKTGQVLDAPPFPVTTTRAHPWYPDLAWDGTNYLAVWQDFRVSDLANPDIYLARISPQGKVLDVDGVAIATGIDHQAWPAVVAMNDGSSALVAWSEDRRTDRFRDFGIYGAFVRTSDLGVLDPGGIVLSDGIGNEMFPSLAPAGAARALMAYHHDDLSAGVGAQRARARFVTSGVVRGGACTSDDQCASRACADGVCCDRACNGTCESCGKTKGTCTALTGEDDPDSCTGERTCDSAGGCRTKRGKSCSAGAECESGVCAATGGVVGICCDRACDGACETCTAVAGTCTLRAARQITPACAPFACDGTTAACPTSCTTDGACPSGTRCDVASGSCIAGASCADAKTLVDPSGATTACAPFTCESGGCRTTCRDVHDCVYPATCDEHGACVVTAPPPTAGGGCSLVPAPGAPRRSFGVLVAALLLLLSARRSRGS